MLNRRKAVIGYATYVVATRMAKRMLKRKAQSAVARTPLAGAPSGRSRRLPLIGAVVAVVAAAALLVRRRGGDAEA